MEEYYKPVPNADMAENQCNLKIKYKNRVKKIASPPESFEVFSQLIRRKYDEFKEGKDTYQVCYLDNEEDHIDISDDEDYEVFLEHIKTCHQPSVKVFLNKRGKENRFNREVDDCQTVHESVMGDTLLSYSTEKPFGMPPPNFDYSQIDKYRREMEKLREEMEMEKFRQGKLD